MYLFMFAFAFLFLNSLLENCLFDIMRENHFTCYNLKIKSDSDQLRICAYACSILFWTGVGGNMIAPKVKLSHVQSALSLCLYPEGWWCNAEGAEVEWFYEDLQDLLELTPKKTCPFHYRGLECTSRKSRNTWSNRQIWS